MKLFIQMIGLVEVQVVAVGGFNDGSTQVLLDTFV